MAKLVYDRPVKVALATNQSMRVPDDEVWRISVHSYGGTMSTPSQYFKLYGDRMTQILLGGAQIFWAMLTLVASLLSQSTNCAMEEVILHG